MTPNEAYRELLSIRKHIEDGYITHLSCGGKADKQTEKDIEAYSIAISALEKQIPKKPSNMRRIGSSFDMSTGMSLSYFEGLCEVCKTSNTNWRAKEKITYCEKCGQALDWSDTE